jgi:hypothetical protein
VPLSNSKTNQALKDLLNTAQVTQHQERIIVTATLPASFLSTL